MLKAGERTASFSLSASDRRVELWAILVKKRCVTLRKMAEMFSVSKNTILSDMDFLTMIHPLRAELGRNGGYYIDIEDPCDLSPLYADHVRLLVRIAQDLPEEEHQMIREVIDVLMTLKRNSIA